MSINYEMFETSIQTQRIDIFEFQALMADYRTWCPLGSEVHLERIDREDHGDHEHEIKTQMRAGQPDVILGMSCLRAVE